MENKYQTAEYLALKRENDALRAKNAALEQKVADLNAIIPIDLRTPGDDPERGMEQMDADDASDANDEGGNPNATR